ncbi:MAG: sulfatase-like hydrolase/transferase [Bacteroidia bacterium]|nr:sulfatase-like hydrolase/transferase [Bacteroidia bacterium]
MEAKYIITSLLLSSFSFAQAVQPARPNILFIVGDDMGYGDVGFHKCKDNPTPNLNALAASGVQFTSGYVSGHYCSPTQAVLLTGRQTVLK